MTSQQNTTGQQTMNQSGTAQNLGRVEEITVNVDTGKVNYLLVSLNPASTGANQPSTTSSSNNGSSSSTQQPATGNSTNMATGSQGSQLVPVPLQAGRWNAQQQMLIYTSSKSLEQAPTISMEQFQSGQTNWQSKADSFWGQQSNVNSQNNNMGSQNNNQSGSQTQ